jgi:hypothetical protein
MRAERERSDARRSERHIRGDMVTRGNEADGRSQPARVAAHSARSSKRMDGPFPVRSRSYSVKGSVVGNRKRTKR